MSSLGGLFALCEAASSVAPTNNNSSSFSNVNNIRPPSPVRSGSASLASSSAVSRFSIKKRPKCQVKLEEETSTCNMSSSALSSCEMVAAQRYAAVMSQSQLLSRPPSKKRKTEQSVKQSNKKKKAKSEKKRNKDKKHKQLSTSTSTSSTDASTSSASTDSTTARSRADSAASSTSSSAMLSRTVTPSSDSSSNVSRLSPNASSIACTAPTPTKAASPPLSSSGPSAAATAKWMAEQNVFAYIGFHSQANMSPTQSQAAASTMMPSPQRKSSGHTKTERKLRTQERKRANDRMLFERAAAVSKGNSKSGIHNPHPSFTAEQRAAIAKLSSPSDVEVTSVTKNVVSAAIDALRWDGTLPTAARTSRSTSPTNHLYAPTPQQPLQQRPHNKKQESTTTMIDSVVQGERRLARLKEDLEILHRHHMLLETTGTSRNSRVAMMMKPKHHQLQHKLQQLHKPCHNLSPFNTSSFNAYPTHANAASIPATANATSAPASPPSSSRLLDVLTERFLERSVSRHNTHLRYRSLPTTAAAASASSTSCVR